MRILIISDTHGEYDNLESALVEEEPFDLLIHLGDSESSLEELEELVDCPIEIVAGNMDRHMEFPHEKVIDVKGHRIMICHGHRVNVNAGLLRLEYMARELEADIAMYGHTHVAYLDQSEDLTIFNPGSLSYPRPWGARPSYGVMTVNDAGEMMLEHVYL